MLTSHATWPSQLPLSELSMKKLFVIFMLLGLSACGGGGGGSSCTVVTRTVTVSWDANNEQSVNAALGGYRVYYSTVSGFTPGDANSTGPFDVPFASPMPTSYTVDLGSGNYYFKVIAYGEFPAGNPTESTPSAQLPVNVPCG